MSLSRPSPHRPAVHATRRLGACCLGLLLVGVGALVSAGDGGGWAGFVLRQSALAAVQAAQGVNPDVVHGDGFEPDCHLDSDQDGLPDCVESGSHQYLGLADTGTDRFDADSDDDGLGDGDEVLGTAAGLDLPTLDVHPLRRDLLIEYDWFEDAEDCAWHSHAPAAAVLQRVAAAFAALPLANPDGSQGIRVLQDVGQGGALSGGEAILAISPHLPGGFDATHAAIKAAHFSPLRIGAFHYVLLAHSYGAGSNSSGYAEVVGDDALVTLACSAEADDLVRTLLHELGHNLGLQHGGFEACNGKPNYNSLLNYRFQFTGLDDDCDGYGDQRRDGYSRGQRPPLDEIALRESDGVCGAPAVDWNHNGVIEDGISFDLQPDYAPGCGALLGRLEDFDDVAHLTLLGIRDDQGVLKGIQTRIACPPAPGQGDELHLDQRLLSDQTTG